MGRAREAVGWVVAIVVVQAARLYAADIPWHYATGLSGRLHHATPSRARVQAVAHWNLNCLVATVAPNGRVFYSFSLSLT